MSYVRAIGGPADDFLKSIIDAGRGVVDDTVDSGKGAAGDLIEDFINSSDFRIIKQEIEAAAAEGVKKEAGKNAVALGLMAMSAGVVGGAFLKGKVGVGLAAAIAAASAGFIVWNASVSTQAPAKKK